MPEPIPLATHFDQYDIITKTRYVCASWGSSPIECLMSSQALIAQSALLRADVAADHYLKVVCLPSRDFASLRLHQTLDPKDVVDDNSDADDDGELGR